MNIDKNVALPAEAWIDILRVLQSNVVWNTNRERETVEGAVDWIEDSIFRRLEVELVAVENDSESAEPPAST